MKTNQMSEGKLQSHGKGWVLILSALLFLLFAGSSARAQDVYKVTMTRTSMEGLTTDCSPDGYVLAHWDSGHLAANGSDLEADGTLGPDLELNIGGGNSPVAWSRKYDPGDGLLSGVFDGCFGGPSGPTNYPGALFIFFEGKGNKSTVRLTWHFEYYIAPGVREHFSLLSDKIPFAAWTGGGVSGTVKGNFDFLHYLNDGTRKVKNYYAEIPGGQDRLFEFVLAIEKVQ
jgi:hypothetical protein